MSTRSSIAVINKDGSVDSVYCHFDGYPEYTGRMLIAYHDSNEDANHIIELGDISILREKLDPPANKNHSFDNALDDVTLVYGRDRGDENVSARYWDNLDDWLSKASDTYWADYCYWWDGNEWHCKSTYEDEEIDLYKIS